MTNDKTYSARRDEASLKERIYEPKYGGKDHSGYETMMKYEINHERMEAFDHGHDHCLTQEKVVLDLVDAARTIEQGYKSDNTGAVALGALEAIKARAAYDRAVKEIGE